MIVATVVLLALPAALAGCVQTGDEAPRLELTVDSAWAVDVDCRRRTADVACHEVNVTVVNHDPEDSVYVGHGAGAHPTWVAVFADGSRADGTVQTFLHTVGPGATEELRIRFETASGSVVETVGLHRTFRDPVVREVAAYEVRTYQPRVELRITSLNVTDERCGFDADHDRCHVVEANVTNHRTDSIDDGRPWPRGAYWSASLASGEAVQAYDVEVAPNDNIRSGQSARFVVEFDVAEGPLVEVRFHSVSMPKPARATVPTG